MICMISLIDSSDEKWNYKIMYQDKFWFVDSLIPFEEMSALEKERFVMNAYVPAFNHFRDKALDQRPMDTVEETLGLTAEDYETEDEGFVPEEGVGQWLVERINDIVQRLEDMEVRMNKKEKDDERKK